MKHLLGSISLIPVCALAVVLSAGNAFAQRANVVGEKPAFDDLPSPEFAGGKQKVFKPKDWLELEAKLRISMSPAPLSKTCERLTVKWYVAVKNPEKPGSMLLLTKDVEHVNAPLDEDVYCSVYLSPASIKRLTGFDRAGKSSVEAVGYEVLINGERLLQETSKFKPGWWSAASDKISRSDTVPLLNKSETPFAAMWWDRFIEVSPSRER
jgi:hypothetical protein